MLRSQKFVTKGGFRAFAAVSSNGSNAQIITFAKLAPRMRRHGANGPEPTFVASAANGRNEPFFTNFCVAMNDCYSRRTIPPVIHCLPAPPVSE